MVRKLLKKLFELCFPLLFCKFWEEIDSIVFPKFNIKNISLLVINHIYMLCFIVDGFLYLWIDTRFLMLPTTTLGPFADSVHLICGTAVFEILFLRSYCLIKMIRLASP